jgi:hypothetical protein
MILPPRPIVELEIGDLSALNSTTMRSDRGFANLWPRASKLHRRDRTAWLSKPSALMLVIAASLRMILRQFSCGCAVVDVDQHTIVHCPPEAGALHLARLEHSIAVGEDDRGSPHGLENFAELAPRLTAGTRDHIIDSRLARS